MQVNERDSQVQRALAEAREKHPELGALLDFYYDLFEVQYQVKAQLPGVELRDDMAMRWRLERGIPQLSFAQLPIEPAAFADLVSRITDVLVRHSPDTYVEQASWEKLDLIGRARTIFDTWPTLTGPEAERAADPGESQGPAESVDLPVAFALAPYLQRAAEAVHPYLDLTLWVQGSCPICGGEPNLALLEPGRGARQLICSRCNSRWNYSRMGCPFCHSHEKQTYYPSADGVYRLYVCPICERYLKTMDLREVHRTVHPEVERLLTVGMDLAAQQKGARPLAEARQDDPQPDP